jgi:hypothetical protein
MYIVTEDVAMMYMYGDTMILQGQSRNELTEHSFQNALLRKKTVFTSFPWSIIVQTPKSRSLVASPSNRHRGGGWENKKG